MHEAPTVIDLRSDTFTKPTDAMRAVMVGAEVGDDVFGEDPTVRRLEERVAEMLGHEAAMFAPTGTMTNQVGVRLHCQPGDEFLCEADCHIFNYEQGAYAQLFGLATQPIPGDGGLLTPAQLVDRIRKDDIHNPRTKLLCLENTHNRLGGRVLPYEGVSAVCAWAQEQGLRRHLDGARLWNAAVATGVPLADWGRLFDTVSVCFSKGLGAPVGSALAGSRELITQARRHRKAMGGGMRQAGVLAAAALHALDHHVDRLADDHANAQLLADAVRRTPGLTLLDDRCDTNLVMFELDPAFGTSDEFCERLERHGVRMIRFGLRKVRAATHLDVSRADVERAAELLTEAPAVAVH